VNNIYKHHVAGDRMSRVLKNSKQDRSAVYEQLSVMCNY